MIPSQRRAWFAAWMSRQARRRIHATFGTVEVAGLQRLVATVRDQPTIIVANHSAYWDGMMLLELSGVQAGIESYVMMDAKNLRKLRFFAAVGAFGFELDSRRDGARAVRYGADLLDRPGRALWVFPQGAERPSHEPLEFFSGAARMAELSGAAVVPVGLRYVFGSLPMPRAIASFGEPLAPGLGRSDAVVAQQCAVQGQLDLIDGYVGGRDASFEVTHRGQPGWFDTLMTAALDRLAAALLLGSTEEQAALAEPKRAFAPANPSGSQGPDEGHQ